MENQLEPNNESQQVKQGNETNVNTYNQRDKGKINMPIRYHINAMFL